MKMFPVSSGRAQTCIRVLNVIEIYYVYNCFYYYIFIIIARTGHCSTAGIEALAGLPPDRLGGCRANGIMAR
jgi:hypothetical protein